MAIIKLGKVGTLLPNQEIFLGTVDVEKCRTLTITCRVTYNGSAANPVNVNLYYSPTGERFDTYPYDSIEIPLSAGETVQKTVNVDVPEDGQMQISIENLDGSVSATNVKVWVAIVRWDEK